jgi:hypothetical protein
MGFIGRKQNVRPRVRKEALEWRMRKMTGVITRGECRSIDFAPGSGSIH